MAEGTWPLRYQIQADQAIARSRGASTYRLLTGHRGVGKTTELLRVADRLMSGQAPRKVFVSFVESERWLDLNDVDAPDVVFQMVRQLVMDLKDQGFNFGWDKFAGFFREFQEILNSYRSGSRQSYFRALAFRPVDLFDVDRALRLRAACFACLDSDCLDAAVRGSCFITRRRAALRRGDGFDA